MAGFADFAPRPASVGVSINRAGSTGRGIAWRGIVQWSRTSAMRVAIKGPCARCTGCWAAKGLSGEHQHRPVSMQTRLTYCAAVARSNRTLRPRQSCAIESTKVVALCTLIGSKH
jgi:hypothetical protein